MTPSSFPGTAYPQPHGTVTGRVQIHPVQPVVRAGEPVVPTPHAPDDPGREYNTLLITTDRLAPSGFERGATVFVDPVAAGRWSLERYRDQLVAVRTPKGPTLGYVRDIDGFYFFETLAELERTFPFNFEIEMLGPVEGVAMPADIVLSNLPLSNRGGG